MGKMRLFKLELALAALYACLCSHVAHADVTSDDEYMRRLQVHQSLAPLGGAPFGEQINPYTGELSFRQTDLVFEGTGPTIRLARQLDSAEAGSLGLIGTPGAPLAIATQGVAEAAGLVALAIEPNKERALNFALGGFLKVFKNFSAEKTLASQAIESVEIGKDSSTVIKAIDNSINQTPTVSNTQQSEPPKPPVKPDPPKNEELQ